MGFEAFACLPTLSPMYVHVGQAWESACAQMFACIQACFVCPCLSKSYAPRRWRAKPHNSHRRHSLSILSKAGATTFHSTSIWIPLWAQFLYFPWLGKHLGILRGEKLPDYTGEYLVLTIDFEWLGHPHALWRSSLRTEVSLIVWV